MMVVCLSCSFEEKWGGGEGRKEVLTLSNIPCKSEPRITMRVLLVWRCICFLTRLSSKSIFSNADSNAG